ncbi:hypothetical protein C8R43DRAFT_975710 [Mycena crocata]|nr:hypothetical protein C8R43DRAFT_975710 [Mycena crocata]
MSSIVKLGVHPLQIAELVDHCIQYLGDSPPTLCACALVSRAWVFAAQSQLFRKLTLEDAVLWLEIYIILIAPSSAHLLQHIRKLEVHAATLKLAPQTFADMCQFPFTHLHTITLRGVNFDRLSVLPLQHLLSAGTLRRLVIRSRVTDPVACAEVWDRVSPSVKHVDWLLIQDENKKGSFPPRSTPIILDSLRLMFIGKINHSLAPQSLFDFSRLRALSLNGVSGTLLHKLAPDSQRLEVLDYIADVCPNVLCDTLLTPMNKGGG